MKKISIQLIITNLLFLLAGILIASLIYTNYTIIKLERNVSENAQKIDSVINFLNGQLQVANQAQQKTQQPQQ